ncbi:hypothetical protein JTB14_030543 [Gonioctena quinquepunctata]|nr:hypothetical protein JTB14_030543 [Gonioctena quinquepunctata]
MKDQNFEGSVIIEFSESCTYCAYATFISFLICFRKFQQLKSDDKAKAESELRELQELLRKESDSVRGQGFSEKELDTLLDRTELYKIMKESKFKK